MLQTRNTILDLLGGDNFVFACIGSGHLPSELVLLTKLKMLYLEDNEFDGACGIYLLLSGVVHRDAFVLTSRDVLCICARFAKGRPGAAQSDEALCD